MSILTRGAGLEQAESGLFRRRRKSESALTLFIGRLANGRFEAITIYFCYAKS